MKIKNILQITACLLVSCGLLRAAEWIEPSTSNVGFEEISKIEQTIACTLPCGNGRPR